MIAPLPGQTRLLLFSATTDDLRTWRGDAADHFPGGYQQVADKFRSGLTIYAFKFVEPQRDIGMSYNGLIYVNGRWRFFPKPWRVAE